MLEGFQFGKPMNIGFRRRNRSLLGGKITGGVIDFLLGDAFGLDEIFEAVRGDVGKTQVGLGGVQVGFGLCELLIDFGRINVGKKLASAHAGADVAIPLFQVPVGAGVDWGLHVGL